MVVVVRHRLLAGPVRQYYELFPRYLLNNGYTPMGHFYGNRDHALLTQFGIYMAGILLVQPVLYTKTVTICIAYHYLSYE